MIHPDIHMYLVGLPSGLCALSAAHAIVIDGIMPVMEHVHLPATTYARATADSQLIERANIPSLLLGQVTSLGTTLFEFQYPSNMTALQDSQPGIR